MTINFKFDSSYWYSGFDGKLFAELMPAQTNYWFIAVMGKKYLASSEVSHHENKILHFLQQHRFNFNQATWQQEKSGSFTQNPFLAKLPAHRAIAICQNGDHSLPQDFRLNSIKVFESQNAPSKVRTGYIYFIVTEDQQYLKIGFSKNPASRLTEAQATYPQTLSMLGTMVGRGEQADELHKKFYHLLVRRGWYSFTQELRQYIKLILGK